MASRADRPYRDERPTPRETRAENGPPRDFDDAAEEHSFTNRPRNGHRVSDPIQVGNALTDTLASAVERGATLLGNNIRALQDETARFVTHRVERDMQAMEEMSRSRNLMELFSVQQRWFTNLTTDYSRRMMRLGRLTGTIADETIESGRRVADEARHSIDT